MEGVSMQELSKIAPSLSGDWFQLGLKLGMRSDRLDPLTQTPQGGPERYCFRMLTKWRKKNGNQSFDWLITKLIEALRQEHRNDQVEIIQIYFADRNNEQNIECVFEVVSGSLTGEWKRIGLHLGLTFDDLNLITAPQPLPDNPALTMLEMWWRATPSQQRRHKLSTALTNLHRMDLVEVLNQGQTQQQPMQGVPGGGSGANASFPGGVSTPDGPARQQQNPPGNFCGTGQVGNFQGSSVHSIQPPSSVAPNSMRDSGYVDVIEPNQAGPQMQQNHPQGPIQCTQTDSYHSYGSVDNRMPQTNISSTEAGSIHEPGSVDIGGPAMAQDPQLEGQPSAAVDHTQISSFQSYRSVQGN